VTLRPFKRTLMYKTPILALLLSCATWSLALGGTSTSNAGQDAGSLATISGCLQKDEGQYSLIDGTGTLHRLAGASKKLSPHVGHEVELTGKPTWITIDATPPGGASNVRQQYVFEVKTVKQLADTCQSR